MPILYPAVRLNSSPPRPSSSKHPMMDVTASAGKSQQQQNQEPSIDTDKLSYEIFSILESKFLFGYDDDSKQLWVPRPLPSGFADVAASATTVSPSSVSGNIKSQRGKVCILSIDGGAGMRGILPGRALSYLEEALRSRSGDPNARVADYFDVAAGTGVGGIFTAMLFATRDGRRPVFRADDTWRLLAEKGHRFFVHKKVGGGGSRHRLLARAFCSGGGEMGGERKMRESRMRVATAGIERAMKEAFGEELTLRNTVKPVLIPCYDLRSGAPFLFSRADALEADGFDFRLWEVCRATWAEPGRFEPVDMRSVDGATSCVGVDGGLVMSNPAAAAITHVLHNKQEFPFVRGVEDLLVLSLGSGGAVSVVKPSSVATAGDNGRVGCGGGRESCCVFSQTAASATSAGRHRHWSGYEQVKRWRAREWARPIARIASDGAADLVDHAVALAFGQCRSSNYVRIQVSTSSLGSFGLDVDSDPSLGNVNMLLGLAEEMLKQKNVESMMFGGKRISEQTNLEKLDWFASVLVLEHQRRSCRIAPTVAFKQATPNSMTMTASS